jgi:hypothetical protein
MKFFVVVKQSTPGDIGYLKLSYSILIQNGGGSKLCLLCCTVGHVMERVARPCVCVCVMGVVCVWWSRTKDGSTTSLIYRSARFG